MVSEPSDEQIRSVVTAAADAVVWADLDGAIRLWNPGAERIFGHSAETALGQSLDLIIPERQRERHWDGWNAAMARGSTKYGPDEMLAVPAVHADGHRISLEFTVGLTRDAGGAITGVVAVMRDVTARREADKELRERLARAERAVAAHDDPAEEGGIVRGSSGS
jgi:PAS domain S-box-containing protein